MYAAERKAARAVTVIVGRAKRPVEQKSKSRKPKQRKRSERRERTDAEALPVADESALAVVIGQAAWVLCKCTRLSLVSTHGCLL